MDLVLCPPASLLVVATSNRVLLMPFTLIVFIDPDRMQLISFRDIEIAFTHIDNYITYLKKGSEKKS